MKQYYAYSASSSKIIGRAGTLEDLLKKLHNPKDEYSLTYRIGLNRKEPWYFYVKNDVHEDDDEAQGIELSVIQDTARKLKII
jgi:hypothetical protein